MLRNVFISPEETEAIRDRLRRERLAMDLAEEGRRTDNETPWTAVIPRSDLSRLHHAVRMLTTHPMTGDQERSELECLADALWSEIGRRVR